MLRSLPGPGSENLRLLTIGSGGWLPTIIALRNSFSAGLSTSRAPVEALRPQMNFLTPLFTGLAIRPRLGTAWEKGERLAKLVGHRRTLLILQTGWSRSENPPGPQEGRLRESSLQAVLRELAAFNKGLCVITTRIPVADLSDHQGSSALRRDLEHLSSDAGRSCSER